MIPNPFVLETSTEYSEDIGYWAKDQGYDIYDFEIDMSRDYYYSDEDEDEDPTWEDLGKDLSNYFNDKIFGSIAYAKNKDYLCGSDLSEYCRLYKDEDIGYYIGVGSDTLIISYNELKKFMDLF